MATRSKIESIESREMIKLKEALAGMTTAKAQRVTLEDTPSSWLKKNGHPTNLASVALLKEHLDDEKVDTRIWDEKEMAVIDLLYDKDFTFKMWSIDVKNGKVLNESEAVILVSRLKPIHITLKNSSRKNNETTFLLSDMVNIRAVREGTPFAAIGSKAPLLTLTLVTQTSVFCLSDTQNRLKDFVLLLRKAFKDESLTAPLNVPLPAIAPDFYVMAELRNPYSNGKEKSPEDSKYFNRLPGFLPSLFSLGPSDPARLKQLEDKRTKQQKEMQELVTLPWTNIES